MRASSFGRSSSYYFAMVVLSGLWQKVGGKRQEAKGRGQEAEGRRQRAGGKRQRVGGRGERAGAMVQPSIDSHSPGYNCKRLCFGFAQHAGKVETCGLSEVEIHTSEFMPISSY
jgi:hypothetical protein